MILSSGRQVEPSELKQKSIDLFIFAGNHEKRVFTAFDYLSDCATIKKSIAFCYKSDFSTEFRKEIEKFQIEDNKEIYELLDLYFKDLISSSPTIVIDYSCMTKPWYYAIILYLSKRDLLKGTVLAYFLYTPSKFADPQEPKPNTEIRPLPGKYIIPTDKPKALIVCLGYERRKAEGIIDHLDPEKCYVFYAKPALDQDFVKAVEENNSDILKSENVIIYPLNDLLSLERELTSVYQLLNDEYHVIIAPLGPKPFTFISMLLSIKNKNIDIWRVGSGSDINEYDR